MNIRVCGTYGLYQFSPLWCASQSLSSFESCRKDLPPQRFEKIGISVVMAFCCWSVLIMLHVTYKLIILIVPQFSHTITQKWCLSQNSMCTFIQTLFCLIISNLASKAIAFSIYILYIMLMNGKRIFIGEKVLER